MILCHVSYADDLTIWLTFIDIKEGVTQMEQDLKSISKWCFRWRMSINEPKTEFMIHSSQQVPQVTIKMNDKPLKQVASKKVLGTIVDEKLNFTAHVDYICSLALSALNRLGPIFNECSIETGIQLYQSYVRPHLERTYPLWCATASSSLSKVDRVQRQSLLRISGAFVSTSTATLEIATHVPPIRMRLEEVLLQEHARICRKKPGDPLRNLTAELRREYGTFSRGRITPIHILNRAAKNINLNFDAIEENFEKGYESLEIEVPKVRNLDLDLGSSKFRTPAQKAAARTCMEQQITHLPEGQPAIFTDGSALSNPGPCGAAAVCYVEGMDSEPLVVKDSVSKFSNNYHGELRGLNLATESVMALSLTHNITQVNIFCDCKAAIAATTTTKRHLTLQSEITKFQQSISNLKHKKNIDVTVLWIPGHADLRPNEIADSAAKTAAKESKQSDHAEHLSLQTVKSVIRRQRNISWQRAWDRHSEGGANFYYNLKPKVPKERYRSIGNKRAESKLIRCQTNHSRLKDHYNKLYPEESPCCECGRSRQTVNHIMFDCSLLEKEREELTNSIEIMYVKHQTPVWEREITKATLLHPQHTDLQTRRGVTRAVLSYLCSVSKKVSI